MRVVVGKEHAPNEKNIQEGHAPNDENMKQKYLGGACPGIEYNENIKKGHAPNDENMKQKNKNNNHSHNCLWCICS